MNDDEIRRMIEDGHGSNSFLAGLISGYIFRIKEEHAPLNIQSVEPPFTKDSGANWLTRLRTVSGHILEVQVSYMESVEPPEFPGIAPTNG